MHIQRNKSAILLLIIISFLPFVAANGLSLVNDTVIEINKTSGIDKDFTFSLRNEEAYTMFNVSFEDNDHVSLPIIDQIAAGATRQVTAKAVGDADFSGIVRVKGFFQSQVGASNATTEITMDFTNGFDLCDISITKGDTVRWINTVNDEVRLKNQDTNSEFAIIATNDTYETTFDTAQILTYYAQRHGFAFTDVCKITILEDTGLVNDPSLDAQVAFDIDVSFEQTTVEVTAVTTEHTVSVFDTDEGVITIKNTGSRPAKEVSLQGEWFSFNKNNFDIASGSTVVVTYTILSAKNGITSTNDTDQTYHKNITISGNFPEHIVNYDITIPFLEIGNGTSTSGKSILDILKEECENDPDFCGIEPKIVYRDGTNNTNGAVDVQVVQDDLNNLFRFFIDNTDSTNEIFAFLKEKIEGSESKLGVIEQRITSLEADNKALVEADSSAINTGIILLLVFCLLIIGGLVFAAIHFYRKGKTQEHFERV